MDRQALVATAVDAPDKWNCRPLANHYVLNIMSIKTLSVKMQYLTVVRRILFITCIM